MKHCSFEGCTGGCHICCTVKRQRVLAPLYEAAQRIIAVKAGNALPEDVLLVAEYAANECKPHIDEETMSWIIE